MLTKRVDTLANSLDQHLIDCDAAMERQTQELSKKALISRFQALVDGLRFAPCLVFLYASKFER